ncbi:hypothetical protein MF672_001560 [Actinomadura sp. ATCC 31491]|uniref:Uncharacterized protein n=1 Tax=Actinomadura luzonensis TaxID=2805427 RepID=A0ABT0FJL1_9ACTN|nr:hypothetical protein [Actinomadura luzonensis]MCK2212492.1 hypothetical protein [Actinomadura luzonensis]
MSTTRSAAVLASGTANAAKLFVAALAFTSAYVGLSAYDSAGPAAAAPTRTVTLSAREVPISRPLAQPAAHAARAAAPAQAGVSAQAGVTTQAAVTHPQARAGAVAVAAVADGAAGCAKSYVARSVLAEAAPGQGVLYRWRLARWSPATKTWRTYLSEHSGFASAERQVEWRPRISGNPGWYRVEVIAEGAATVASDRFQVSC